MGSGTTALVARKMARRCVGIELNPEYAELIVKRTRQLSLFAQSPSAVKRAARRASASAEADPLFASQSSEIEDATA